MPYLKGEKIIANVIGVSPEQIWPNKIRTVQLPTDFNRFKSKW